MTTAVEVDGETSAADAPEGERRILESVATPAASEPTPGAGTDHSSSVPSLCSIRAQDEDAEVAAAAAMMGGPETGAGLP